MYILNVVLIYILIYFTFNGLVNEIGGHYFWGVFVFLKTSATKHSEITIYVAVPFLVTWQQHKTLSRHLLQLIKRNWIKSHCIRIVCNCCAHVHVTQLTRTLKIIPKI